MINLCVFLLAEIQMYLFINVAMQKSCSLDRFFVVAKFTTLTHYHY